MTRFILTSLALVCALVSSPAHANYTIDLIWADTQVATLNVPPGDPLAPSGGTKCHDGQLSTAGAGRCLFVRFASDSPFEFASVTIGWNAAESGLAIDYVGFRSFGQFGAFSGLTPLMPAPAGIVDCVPSCDTAFGSFGGASVLDFPAGTYVLGSVLFDTSGVLPGQHRVEPFFRTGVDGVIQSMSVQFGDVILNVVPEPGTAGLFALGVAALCLRGRGRRS